MIFMMGTLNEQAFQENPVSVQQIVELKNWTPSLLSFRCTRAPDFRFSAGQYARIGLPTKTGMVWRAYSMVSAPLEDDLEFFGVLIPGGFFSEKLKHLRIGDPIWMERENYGFMTPDRFIDGEDLWMLATGTGLGPFISILRDDAVWQQFKRLILVHGVRHDEELAYQSELIGMQAAVLTNSTLAQLHLVHCVTRGEQEAENSTVTQLLMAPRLTNRITTALMSGQLEQAAQTLLEVKTSRVMMCGNPQMVEETRKLLHQRGMKPCRRLNAGEFLSENYW